MEKLHITCNSPFPTVFSNHLKNSLPFPSNLKLLSTNSLRLDESKICCFGKGQTPYSALFQYSAYIILACSFFYCYIAQYSFQVALPSPIVQSVVYQSWEQEIAGSIPGSAYILSED